MPGLQFFWLFLTRLICIRNSPAIWNAVVSRSPVGLRSAVLAADIHHRQVILVVAARILLHELALPLDEQNEDEQRRGDHELDAHQNGPEVLSGGRP